MAETKAETKPETKTAKKPAAKAGADDGTHDGMHKQKEQSRWTHDTCMKVARRFATRDEWAHGAPSSYKAAVAKGWDGDCCKHMTGAPARVKSIKPAAKSAPKSGAKSAPKKVAKLPRSA